MLMVILEFEKKAIYRPVTLTSQVIKLFEKLFVKKMANFMDENELYNN